MEFKVIENNTKKSIRSAKYNYNFDKKTGFFMRWGELPIDDPLYAPGPEILDVEISAGKCSGSCKFCYKGNNASLDTNNMTFSQFKTILDKMPKTLTQVAFGICDIDTNPDFFQMMEYCRESGVIPNYTCNGFRVSGKIARKTAKICGAVAVSVGGETEKVKKYYRRKKKI